MLQFCVWPFGIFWFIVKKCFVVGWKEVLTENIKVVNGNFEGLDRFFFFEELIVLEKLYIARVKLNEKNK